MSQRGNILGRCSLFTILVLAANCGHSQGFLNRIEQRVRDGLRLPEGQNSTVPSNDPSNPVIAPATSEATGVIQPLPGPKTAIPNIGTPSGGAITATTTTEDPPVLGLELEATYLPGGGLRVSSVTAKSPAATGGVRVGDLLQSIDGRTLVRMEDVEQIMRGHRAGDRLTLRIKRDGQLLETTPVLMGKPVDKPSLPPALTWKEQSIEKKTAGGRLGVEVDDVTAKDTKSPVQRGAIVVTVQPNSPAAAIGIQVGDVIVAIDGRVITGVRSMVTVVSGCIPGQQVEVSYFHGEEMLRKSAPIAGVDGMLSVAAFEELKKRNDGTTEKASVGMTSWLGGITRMFGGKSDVDTTPAAVAPVTSDVAAKPETLPLADSRVIAKENQQLKDAVQKLKARIAELEQKLNGNSTK